MASPKADSAAATANINNVKNWPAISSKWTEKKTKLKLIVISINSIHIKIVIKFLRVRKTPETLIKKEKKIKCNIIQKINISLM